MPQSFSFVLFCASMLGYVLFIHDRLHYKIEAAPLLAILFQIFVLFSAALFNLLPYAADGLFALGLLLLIFTLARNYASLGRLVRQSFPPGMALFWLALLFFMLLIPRLVYANWDEFSHWGLIFKLLTLTNQLPGRESVLFFKDYPPGGAVYEYFVARIIGVSEGSSFFAMNLVLLSSVMVLLRGFSWRQSYRAVLAFAFGFLWLYAVGYKVNLLLVDSVLGLLFAAGVIFAAEEAEICWKNALPVMLIAAVLPAVKQSGLLFGLGVAVIYVALALVRRRKGIVAAFHSANGRFSPRTAADALLKQRNTVFILVTVLISSLVLYKAWDLHLTQLKIDRAFRQDFTVQEVVKQFLPQPTPRAKTTLITFIKGVIKRPLGDVHTSTLAFVGIFLAIGLAGGSAFYHQDPDQYTQLLSKQILLTGWISAYLLTLLLAYLISFSAYEGMQIAGFERYIGSAVLGWGFILYDDIQHFPYTLKKIPAAVQKFALNAILLIGVLLMAFLSSESLAQSIPEMPPARIEVQQIAQAFSSKIPPSARVYHIWQNINGYEHFVMRYELAPRITEFYGWSVGTPYSNEDVWTVPITFQEWFSILQKDKYDYVLVSKADSRFWVHFGSLFHGYDGGDVPQLFRVTPGGLERVN